MRVRNRAAISVAGVSSAFGVALIAVGGIGSNCCVLGVGDCSSGDGGPIPASSCTPPPPPPDIPKIGLSQSPSLHGFVDLHAHPMSNLGFAGKLVYGGDDYNSDAGGGALLPTDPDCQHGVRATSVQQALGHCGSVHGSDSSCGDVIRQQIVSALQSVLQANDPPPDSDGYCDFGAWPQWNDVTHQVMWIDWIHRAYLGGLRVMVALAVNNQTLADAVAGPKDGPDDDAASANLQIAEIQALVGRHLDWMGIAHSSDELEQIVQANKLAIVLGLEVDNIGDFNKNPNFTTADVTKEIQRLHDLGVRYLFPVHLIDNPFGTTAAYEDLFNLSNLREAGHFWNLVCSQPQDHITYEYSLGNPLQEALDPFSTPTLYEEMAALMVVKLGMGGDVVDSPTIPSCPSGIGMVNQGAAYPGLTPIGKFAVQEMMRLGMLIDVDHMSQASVADTLVIAENEQYPVNSGHNVVRSDDGGSERNFTAANYARIAALHGMAGVGVAGTDEKTWVGQYLGVLQAMGNPVGGAGFGTDADGLSPLMPAPTGVPELVYDPSSYPQSGLGLMSWNYNDAGVAHYGLLADFVKAVGEYDAGAAVSQNLMQGAQYFHDSWKMAENYSAAHQGDAGVVAAISRLPWGQPAAPPQARRSDHPAPPRQSPNPMARSHVTRDRAIRPGAYILRLEESPAYGTKARAFEVEVTRDGDLTRLRGKEPASAPKAEGEGGFRGRQFVLRSSSGRQNLALFGAPVEPGTFDELHGGFIAYVEGLPPVTGAFTLQAATAPAGAPTVDSFGNVGAFLDELHRTSP